MVYVPIFWVDWNYEIKKWHKFIGLLNKIRVGNVDEAIQKQIWEKLIDESDINYPKTKNVLHMFAKNYPTVKHNRKILGKTYIINAID